MTLKRPVTLAAARRWPAAAARRESFCARMGGMREKLTSDRTARDPRSKINRALAAWDCDEPELLERKHVTKGIRPMKITRKMVGAEARGNPAQKVEVMLQGKLPNGGMIRLQKRAGKFDTIINSTGYAWHYVAKGTTENDARSVYDYWMTMQNPRRKPTVSRKISQLTREGYPQRQAVAIALSEQRAGKVRENPAMAKLYTVHTVTGDGKPRDPIAHFRKRSDALTYAKAYAKAYGAPVVLTSKAL